MRRMLALTALLMLLAGCAAEPASAPAPAPAAATPPEAASPAPAAKAAPTPPPDAGTELMYLLAASVWQDIYDENYSIAFDTITGTMTETNKALNAETVYRISVEDGALHIWAEDDGERRSLPYALEEGLLAIDYGDPVGVVTYAPAAKTP